MLLLSALALILLSSAAQARIGSPANRVLVNYPEATNCDGEHLWTLNEVKSHSKDGVCLMVLYDTVYEVYEFAKIHRGGSFSIIRNCGTDATWGYEKLQCIPGVPDHTPAILNMLRGGEFFGATVAGYIKGSDADPCSGSPPSLPTPDFDDCPVYDVVTCEDLGSMPNNGLWTLADVEATGDKDHPNHDDCYGVLYDYVFAFNSPPQPNWFTPPGSGKLTFAEKHGGGSKPVLNNCWTDMTEKFEDIRNMPGKPDHTKGALNAIIPFLVGVIETSDVNPCRNEPPTPCQAFKDSDLEYFSVDDVRASNSFGCYVTVLGKVYDLRPFMPYHYGGSDEIRENCGQDITGDFLGQAKHTLVQLGAVKQFQRGVIENGMADPCGQNYVPNPDGSGYASDESDEEENEETQDSKEEEDSNED